MDGAPATVETLTMRGDYLRIGDRLRRFRKERGLTQEQLAELAGCTFGYISHLETGRSDGWSAMMLLTLASALEKEPWQLLGHSIPPDDEPSGTLAEIVQKLGSATPEQLTKVSKMIDLLGVGGTND